MVCPEPFDEHAAVFDALLESNADEELLQSVRSLCGQLLQTVQALLQSAYHGSLFFAHEAFRLLHVDFLLKLSIEVGAYNVELVNPPAAE